VSDLQRWNAFGAMRIVSELEQPPGTGWQFHPTTTEWILAADAEREIARLTAERDEQADRSVAAVRELAMALAEIDARPTYAEVQAWRAEFGIVRKNTSGMPDRYDNLPAYVARLRRAQEVRP
jgi:hypothetical protein